MRELQKDEPAYPRSYSADGHNGMSLRDYFAAEALRQIRESSSSGFNHNPEVAAKVAYSYADAMLAERVK